MFKAISAHQMYSLDLTFARYRPTLILLIYVGGIWSYLIFRTRRISVVNTGTDAVNTVLTKCISTASSYDHNPSDHGLIDPYSPYRYVILIYISEAGLTT
jgi:hypothetical protein